MKTQAILIAAIALLLGTEAALIKPDPGTSVAIKRPVLSPDLSKLLYFAQTSLSTTIQKESKLIQKVPRLSELALRDLHIRIDDDISVKLSNLKLLSELSIDVKSAKPNLEFLNLALDIDFGTIQVGGNFEIVSKKFSTEIPVIISGEFILENSQVKATGKVGLSLQTNLFKTINHNLAYQPSESHFAVSYLQNNIGIVRELQPKSQETKIVAHINRQLNSLLNRMVKKRLDDILGAVPVDKLIGEERVAESYREYARDLRALANDYVDSILENIRNYIEENGLQQIDIPDIEQGFEQNILGLIIHGSFAALGGTARDLSTINRTGDCNLDISSTGALVVSGYLGLGVLHLEWERYVIEFQNLEISGELTADVGQNSIFLQVEIVLTPQLNITLVDFRIEQADDIEIEITGLGIFSWLFSLIVTWVVDLFHDQIIGLLESQLRTIIEELLPNIDIPFIS